MATTAAAQSTITASGAPLPRGVAVALVACGLASSVLYVGTDSVVAMLYPGYSYLDQAVSELSAIGAPTRTLWLAMTFLHSPLLIAFGTAVRKIGRDARRLRATGTLIVIWGLLGYAWLPFPMHMRGDIGSATDTMHLVMSGVTVCLFVVMIAVGSGVAGQRFRVYSLLTIMVMLAFGALTAVQAPNVAAQLPTPWMGVLERVSVFAPVVWVAVLSLLLLRRTGGEP